MESIHPNILMNGGCVANDDISIDDTFNWNLYQLSVSVVFFLSLRSFRMLPIPNLHFYSLHSLPLPFPLSLSLWMYTTFVLCLWHVRIRCIKLLCWFLSGWLCSSTSFSLSPSLSLAAMWFPIALSFHSIAKYFSDFLIFHFDSFNDLKIYAKYDISIFKSFSLLFFFSLHFLLLLPAMTFRQNRHKHTRFLCCMLLCNQRTRRKLFSR